MTLVVVAETVKTEVKRKRLSKISVAPRKEISRFAKQTRKTEKLQKPFGFCCDEKLQDFNTKYDERKPPFTSSLTNVVLNGGGPDLKFRIKDIFFLQATSSSSSSPRIASAKSATHKVHLKTTTANVGACKWSHGPINWYLEDEIARAQEIIIKNKQKHRGDRIKVLFTRKSNNNIFSPFQYEEIEFDFFNQIFPDFFCFN